MHCRSFSRVSDAAVVLKTTGFKEISLDLRLWIRKKIKMENMTYNGTLQATFGFFCENTAGSLLVNLGIIEKVSWAESF